MSFKIYFKHNLDVKIDSNQREQISFLKITPNNFSETKELIQKSIDTFNSEIEWSGMWDIVNAENRISQNEILYILLENEIPIGHVWYQSHYLYNAFVSNVREDGDSTWFIQETMWDMKQNYNLSYIKLYVDDWNKRAIRFWKKLNFIKEDYGR